VILLGVSVALEVLGVYSGLSGVSLVDRVTRGEVVGLVEDAMAQDNRDLFLAVTGLIGYVAAGIAFIVWFHAAYGNLPHLGIQRFRFGRGYPIGCWFIPIINLVRPKQIMDDIWRGSDPSRPEVVDATEGRVPAVVHWWWAFFILAGVAGNVAFQLGKGAQLLPEIRSAYVADAVSSGLSIAAGVLAMVVVRGVSANQPARRLAVAPLPPDGPPEPGAP
jgi:hypothetical protein